MGEQDVSTTPASNNRTPDKSGRRPSMLKGILAKRPFAKRLLLGYSFALPAYCAIIGLANSQRRSWMGWWIDLWRPVVRWLRGFVPLFDNMANALHAKGYGYRTDIIHHLLAVSWITSTVVFAVLLLTLLSFTRSEWHAIADAHDATHLAKLAAAGALFFFAALYWITYGFHLAPSKHLFAYHVYDAILPMLAVYFLAFLLFGLGLIAASAALIVGPTGPPSSWDSGPFNDVPPDRR